MVVELEDIRGQIDSGGEQVSLGREFNISAGQKAPFSERKLRDQGAVVLVADPGHIVGIKFVPAPGIVVPENISPDRPDRKTLALPEGRHRDPFPVGRRRDRIIKIDVLDTAVIELAAVALVPGRDVSAHGIRIGQIKVLHTKRGILEDGCRVITVILMEMGYIEAQVPDSL